MKRLTTVAVLLWSAVAAAEPYAVGSTMQAVTLEDQHGTRQTIDESVKIVLFSRDMEGGDLIKQALAGTAPDFLQDRHAVYVADISGMPRLISRMFAIPKMRKRPYRMLLDRDGSVTKNFPDVKGKATVMHVAALEITRIDHLSSADAVRTAVADAGRSDAAAK
jgi:hypothetical protein